MVFHITMVSSTGHGWLCITDYPHGVSIWLGWLVYRRKAFGTRLAAANNRAYLFAVILLAATQYYMLHIQYEGIYSTATWFNCPTM
jgi:hypothetical protein